MLTSKFSIFVWYLSSFSLGSAFFIQGWHLYQILTYHIDIICLLATCSSRVEVTAVARLWWLTDDVQFDIFKDFWRHFPSSWLRDTYWACFSNWSYSSVCCIFAGVITFSVSRHKMNLSLLTQYKHDLTEMQRKCVSTSCSYVLKRMLKSTRSTILKLFGFHSLGCFSMIVIFAKSLCISSTRWFKNAACVEPPASWICIAEKCYVWIRFW